jgi:hypothetical protein
MLKSFLQWNERPPTSLFRPHKGVVAGGNMTNFPTTKREADTAAVWLFCLFAMILVGLVAAGIL